MAKGFTRGLEGLASGLRKAATINRGIARFWDKLAGGLEKAADLAEKLNGKWQGATGKAKAAAQGIATQWQGFSDRHPIAGGAGTMAFMGAAWSGKTTLRIGKVVLGAALVVISPILGAMPIPLGFAAFLAGTGLLVRNSATAQKGIAMIRRAQPGWFRAMFDFTGNKLHIGGWYPFRKLAREIDQLTDPDIVLKKKGAPAPKPADADADAKGPAQPPLRRRRFGQPAAGFGRMALPTAGPARATATRAPRPAPRPRLLAAPGV